jgi:large subunit ribosomal protein L3
MGGEKVTVQNLEVVGVRPEENILLVKGGIPGARGSLVVIRKAMKGTK